MTVEKLQKKFDPAQFAMEIERLVAHSNLTYLEAIVVFAEANDLEVEAMGPLVKKCAPICQKLEAECRRAHLMHDSASEASLDRFL